MTPKLEFKVDLNNTTWYFTPPARLAVWKRGAANVEQLREFVGRLVARQILRVGITAINWCGVGVRLTKHKFVYRVTRLAE